MNREELKDMLTVAGNKFDGHATHGSVEETLKVIDKLVDSIVPWEGDEYEYC